MTVPITPRPDPPKPEDVKAQYGFVALLAQSIPEISGLLDRATRESWTADRFSMEVANTSWWRNTPSGQRQWITQQIADPATANSALDIGGNSVLQRANEIGVGLSVDQARAIWVESKIHNLDDKNLTGLIFARAKPIAEDLTKYGGKVGQIVNEALKMAYSYGYQSPSLMDDINEQVRLNMFSGGDVGLEGWRSKMINYASRTYAPWAEQIRGGETVADIAKPYQDAFRKILEVQDVPMTDPLIQQALQGKASDKGPLAPAVWEFEKGLRQDARWGYTQNARETAAQTATAIGKAFGMIG